MKDPRQGWSDVGWSDGKADDRQCVRCKAALINAASMEWIDIDGMHIPHLMQHSDGKISKIATSQRGEPTAENELDQRCIIFASERHHLQEQGASVSIKRSCARVP